MTTKVISANQDLDGAFRQVAREIFRVCSDSPSDQPIAIGLCGGRSVVGLLGALDLEASAYPKELTARLHFFMVDERLVPISDPQSNYGGLKSLLFDSLLSRGSIAERQLHPFIMQPNVADFGCSAYLDLLKSCGGRFSVVVLGVGEDGHIASLFPKHPALAATGDRFITLDDSPKPPAGRMSASPGLIVGSDLSVVLALGEGKRAAWNAFNDERVSESECPAKLAKRAKSCLVLTDLSA